MTWDDSKTPWKEHIAALHAEQAADPRPVYPNGLLAYLKWPLPDPLPAPSDGIAALLAWQAGRCASCGAPPRRLILDHDHETGLIRGFLCGSCNVQEGFGSIHYREYRENPPAKLLGLAIPYPKKSGSAMPQACHDVDDLIDNWAQFYGI